VQILFEDEHLLVVDKPAGLLVHRSALDAHTQDTVIERLRCSRMPCIAWTGRPPVCW